MIGLPRFPESGFRLWGGLLPKGGCPVIRCQLVDVRNLRSRKTMSIAPAFRYNKVMDEMLQFPSTGYGLSPSGRGGGTGSNRAEGASCPLESESAWAEGMRGRCADPLPVGKH